ncbi:hypothetical protein M0R45_033718 [Rubus argutus]|uniref:F-box domain-containing protein n=1 Tax=Rubus argutus TaxID=59490 RepID=A0AAW1WP68_RUBAR
MDGTNVVLNILCRLPVKSLKRFQSASKSCHDLIHKPDFITQHLHVFNSSRKFDDERRHSSCLLVNGIGTWWERYRPTRFLHKVYINLLDLDETNGEVNSRHVLNLPLDYEDENPDVQILGPCNGIYCLHRTNEYDMLHVITVVNVALREVKLVPEPNIPLPLGFQQMRYGTHCVGFGFDPKTSDYKFVLVRVCYLDSWDGEYDHLQLQLCGCYITKTKRPCLNANHNDRPHYTSQIVVYSLNCNSWKNLDDYVHDSNLVELEYADVCSGGHQCSTYLDGVCYWWMYSHLVGGFSTPGDYWTLLYFNLVDQVLGQMRLPPEMLVFDDSDGRLLSRAGSISVYEESLCVIITMGDWTTDMRLAENYKPGFPYFDIWVMHHPDSWTKQFTMKEAIEGLWRPSGFCSSNGRLFITDMTYPSDDDQTMMVTGRLVIYDPSTQQCTNFHVSRPDETGNRFGVTAYAYSESLVSVIGDVRDDQNMLFTIAQDHLFHDLTALGKRLIYGRFRFWDIDFDQE